MTQLTLTLTECFLKVKELRGTLGSESPLYSATKFTQGLFMVIFLSAELVKYLPFISPPTPLLAMA